MKKLIDEFKEFILTGNVLMAAIAFILGLATKQVIDAFVNNIVNPFVGAIVGKPSFDDLTFGIGDATIKYGTFITALVNLVLVGLVLFAMVKVYDTYQARQKAESDAAPEEPNEEIVLLREIRDALASRS
jgi:large conductance mechanosensitive channel